MISVQQINTRKINGNTENFIAVTETGRSEKNKLKHQQDFKIPLSNAFETLLTKKCQDKLEFTVEEKSILPSFNHPISKRRQKEQSTKHHKQPEAYITNNQHEDPFQQNSSRMVPGKLERKFASSVIATK